MSDLSIGIIKSIGHVALRVKQNLSFRRVLSAVVGLVLNCFVQANSGHFSIIGSDFDYFYSIIDRLFFKCSTTDACDTFVQTAREYLGEEDAKRVLAFHTSGLESFYPDAGRFDCIWIQWVTGYLSDADLVS